MERIGQLFSVRGKSQEPVAQVTAGDIGAVSKLSLTTTSDTLTSREKPTVLSPISFPSPIFSMALRPKTKGDLDKMGSVLARLLEEDPVLQVRREQDTGETLLVGLGDTHVEVTVERLRRKFGVEVVLDTPRVPYKETISIPVKTEYRHKKQTGGHGQFGHVFLEMEPLPRNSGVHFEERLVGQALSRTYVPSVEKGVREASQEGVLAGYPVTDIKAVLYDGKEHPVDSSDICFKIAGAGSFRLGLEQGKPLLIEPIVKLTVTVPESYTGDIIADLNTKRGKVLGMNPEDGNNTIEALVPLAEVQRYSIDLRSLTQGNGEFSLEFSHYEEVPPYQAQKIMAAKQAEKAKSSAG
jgi:elongation factor G